MYTGFRHCSLYRNEINGKDIKSGCFFGDIDVNFSCFSFLRVLDPALPMHDIIEILYIKMLSSDIDKERRHIMNTKSKILKIIGIAGITSVACCAIAWIGLSVSPPWETNYCDDELTE